MKKKNHSPVLCILFSVIISGGFLLGVLLPKAESSFSERRRLATAPTLSLERVINGRFMTDFEDYVTDHVPFRDTLRQIKAISAFHLFHKKDNHKIYVEDGYAVKMEYPLRDRSLQRAAKIFSGIRQKYLDEKNRIYFALIPDKNFFLGEKSGHLQLDYGKMEKMLAKDLPFGKWIDLTKVLTVEDYYQTDTHWKQENLVKTAEYLAKEMDRTIETNYQMHKVHDEFRGVYYGQSGLPLPAEPIHYLTSPKMENYRVFDGQNNRKIELYDLKKATGRDPYEMFLGGNLSLVTIENPDSKEKKELIVFRDSFGSSFVPLLASAYSKITLLDIRYISSANLDKLVDFKDADILFLYSSIVLNHSEELK